MKIIYDNFTKKECLHIINLIKNHENEEYKLWLEEVSPVLELSKNNPEKEDFILNDIRYKIINTKSYKFFDNNELVWFIEWKEKNNFFHIDAFATIKKWNNYWEKMLLGFSNYLKINKFTLFSSLHAINYCTNLEKK